MNRTHWTIVSGLVLISIAAIASTRLTNVSKQIESDGIQTMDVDLKLSVGRFEISKSTLPDKYLAEINGNYDEEKYEYSHELERRGSDATFYFESEMIDHHGVTEHNGRENRWQLGFSPEVDCRFDVELGAAELTCDFGDLSVSDLKLEIGAADAKIDFSAPNRTTLRDLKVDAGACKLRIDNLGNSNFEFLDFEGGMGSFELDFSGRFDFEAEAKIDVGLGSIDIVVPEGIGVRLEAEENWFNSIDFSKREFSKVRGKDGVWETENFRSAKGRLTLILDVGMGSADIKFR